MIFGKYRKNRAGKKEEQEFNDWANPKNMLS